VTGNTSYANFKDGLSVEGVSTGTTVRDNVLVDNGLTTGEYDLYVDDAAVSGFSSNRDVIRSQPGAIAVKYNLGLFATLAAYAQASGQEAQGSGADPRFVDANGRDLRPTGDSPMVDAADSGAPGFRAADHDGRSPVDDPVVVNSGTGAPAYADIGAYEYVGPAARVAVSPASGIAPFTVTADASTTTALGAPVVSYGFTFGDGGAAGPQSTPSASHLFTSAGTFTVTVTATDGAGFSDTAASTVVVQGDRPPSAVLTVTPSLAVAPVDVVADATGSSDTDNTPIANFTFACGNGTSIGPQTLGRATCHYVTTGTFTVTVTVRDTAGLVGTASRTVSVVVDNPPTASLQITPGSGKVGKPMNLDASGSRDTDPTPIATYRFACGNGVIVGPQTSSKAPCTYSKAGTYTASVTVTDTAGKSATATASAKVK
jgi:hypothetical protein